MNTRTCSKCLIEKPATLEYFAKGSKRNKFGLKSHCKICQSEYRKEWYDKNADRERKKSLDSAKTEHGRELRQLRYQKQKQKICERNRIRRRTPHARKLANIARNKKYHNDMSFRLSVNLRARMRAALKGITKNDHTMDLIGCSIESLKTHLESKFTKDMSWSNYGYRGWHIDHILPCDSFDLTNPNELKKCFHWTNLQPLWWHENMSKNNRII